MDHLSRVIIKLSKGQIVTVSSGEKGDEIIPISKGLVFKNHDPDAIIAKIYHRNVNKTVYKQINVILFFVLPKNIIIK